jgi:hypothetical protein
MFLFSLFHSLLSVSILSEMNKTIVYKEIRDDIENENNLWEERREKGKYCVIATSSTVNCYLNEYTTDKPVVAGWAQSKTDKRKIIEKKSKKIFVSK